MVLRRRTQSRLESMEGVHMPVPNLNLCQHAFEAPSSAASPLIRIGRRNFKQKRVEARQISKLTLSTQSKASPLHPTRIRATHKSLTHSALMYSPHRSAHLKFLSNADSQAPSCLRSFFKAELSFSTMKTTM